MSGGGGTGGGEPDYRFTLANERTFLAWVRTALGLLAGGLFLLHAVDPSVGTVLLALLLCAGSGVAIVGGYRRFRESDRAIRAGEALPAGGSTRLLAASVMLAVVVVALSAVPMLLSALGLVGG